MRLVTNALHEEARSHSSFWSLQVLSVYVAEICSVQASLNASSRALRCAASTSPCQSAGPEPVQSPLQSRHPRSQRRTASAHFALQTIGG